MDEKRRTINIILGAVCLVVGSTVCGWLIGTKPSPAVRSRFARVREVAVAVVEPHPEATPIVGHGTVRAKHQIKIVPQVSGRLVRVHEDLAVGKVIPQGDLLFEIEPNVYEARVRQVEAEIHGLEATLARSDQELVNLDQRIANTEQMLAIDEKDYLTYQRLYEQENVGTERDVELAYQKYLRQKDALIELKSRRSIIPHVKLETEAQLEASRSRLKRAGHDLENTKIFCPFDARVELVAAYRSQVVTAHFSIATLTDLSAFELSVGIDPRDLRWLAEAIRPDVLNERQDDPRPEVRVHWSLHGQKFAWRGFVTRFERVDEATRLAQLVVEVRNVDMVASVDVGSNESRPTLAIGMHCRAELPAAVLPGALLIPRHAIYDNRWVYVFEPDAETGDDRVGRLARREVPMLRSIGGAVLVDYSGRVGTEVCELEPGERIVVSPLIKPVVGMKIRVRDERVARSSPLPEVAPSSVSAAVDLQLGPVRGSALRRAGAGRGSLAALPLVLGQVGSIRGEG